MTLRITQYGEAILQQKGEDVISFDINLSNLAQEMLEAMQERSVTVGKTTHSLATPFLVLATQNPLEMEGTYPLPEAQLDRFMFMVKVNYPTHDEEREILRRTQGRIGQCHMLFQPLNHLPHSHGDGLLVYRHPASEDCAESFAVSVAVLWSLKQSSLRCGVENTAEFGNSPNKCFDLFH